MEPQTITSLLIEHLLSVNSNLRTAVLCVVVGGNWMMDLFRNRFPVVQSKINIKYSTVLSPKIKLGGVPSTESLINWGFIYQAHPVIIIIVGVRIQDSHPRTEI